MEPLQNHWQELDKTKQQENNTITHSQNERGKKNKKKKNNQTIFMQGFSYIKKT